jgi:hypothetical protein
MISCVQTRAGEKRPETDVWRGSSLFQTWLYFVTPAVSASGYLEARTLGQSVPKCMARPQLANWGHSLRVWSVAVNHSDTTYKGWSSSVEQLLALKTSMLRNVRQDRILRDSYEHCSESSSFVKGRVSSLAEQLLASKKGGCSMEVVTKSHSICIYLSVHLSIHPTIYLFIHLSI